MDLPQGGGFMVAFAAGLLSFGSPCVLPMVPAYMAYIAGASLSGGTASPKRRAVALHTIAFVAGFTGLLVFLGAWVGLARWALSLAGDGGALSAGLTDVTFVLREMLVRVGSVALAVLGVRVAMDMWGTRPWPWLWAGLGVAAATWLLSSGTAPDRLLNAVTLGAVPLLGARRDRIGSLAVGLTVIVANASHFFLTVDRTIVLLDVVGLALESLALGLLIYVGGRTWRFYQTVRPIAVGPPAVPRSYMSSAGVGLVFGAGWTPCTGPNLAMILALAAASSTAVVGSLLLLAYAAGLAVPFLAAGWLMGGAARSAPSLGRFAKPLATANAALLMAMAALAISGQLAQLAGTPWLLEQLR